MPQAHLSRIRGMRLVSGGVDQPNDPVLFARKIGNPQSGGFEKIQWVLGSVPKET